MTLSGKPPTCIIGRPTIWNGKCNGSFSEQKLKPIDRYDPGRLTTRNGKLVITLDEIYSHGMNFEGGSKF